MNEITKTVSKDEFLVNFDARHIIDGLSPFRKKWTIIVFMEFTRKEVITFQEIQKKYSIAPSILASTLKELKTESLVSRKVVGEIPPFGVEYKLTPHGKKLLKALTHLIEWIYENRKID